MSETNWAIEGKVRLEFFICWSGLDELVVNNKENNDEANWSDSIKITSISWMAYFVLREKN